MSTTPAGWEGILNEGETILWQGRPGHRLVIGVGQIAAMIFGLFFSGFALLWMILAAQAGGFFWMFGLIHFSVGLSIGVLPPFWSAWSRRHTWYTLTDRRAFIATDIPLMGRKLKDYPIDTQTPLTWDDGERGNVWFANEYRKTKNGSRKIPIGFERIPDARKVYDLCRKVKSSAE
ncbi:aspartate carbamoyltransferase catalytic subunit [Psychromarinibacter halotolerans]|uniref:Aspartate carbamoyltransferase catalytic subunit n=1 Tax=Psychromarinibacter halotolerans TaxID=1775175 RepID=A0ABV7GN69_9RHOB|nr:aspartate carbamoyltransferase catalytic subunit [Psychromarinibacter halotolerans]MDF0595419.1 aspartate carbamoyltransferase catalytic subunit [Psychromarinibacter halotolerans]